jgi:hypothetical protein
MSVDAARADDRDVVRAGVCFTLADEIGDVLWLHISCEIQVDCTQLHTGQLDEILVASLAVIVSSVCREQVGYTAFQSWSE